MCHQPGDRRRRHIWTRSPRCVIASRAAALEPPIFGEEFAQHLLLPLLLVKRERKKKPGLIDDDAVVRTSFLLLVAQCDVSLPVAPLLKLNESNKKRKEKKGLVRERERGASLTLSRRPVDLTVQQSDNFSTFLLLLLLLRWIPLC